MFDTDRRRLVVGSIMAGILGGGLYLGLETTTDLSGGPLGAIAALFAVSAMQAVGWLWDAKITEN